MKNIINKLFSLLPRWGLILSLFFLAGLIFLVFYANGTGDDGDSVTHFLASKYSWKHPELFLYHWGKPVFTLISSPFSNLGFEWLKVFNACLSFLSVILTIMVAKELKYKRIEVIPLLAASIPYFIFCTLSGLTEPMFNFWTMTGVFLFIKRNFTSASIWFSFLPFVRSEGLVVIVIIMFYLILVKKYKSIPFLLTGHLIYALIGKIAGKNLFWVFTEMSYAQLSSGYGKGTWNWFFINLPEMLGICITILFITGLGLYVYSTFKSFVQKKSIRLNELFLIYGIASSVFMFHVIAFGLGWFNSMGILRVICGVMSLFILIALSGFNFIVDLFKGVYKKLVIVMLIICVIVVPFIYKELGYDYKEQFQLNASQEAITKAANFIKYNFNDYRQRTYAYEAPYIAVALNNDFYDKSLRKALRGEFITDLPSKTIIVWDDWYAVVEGKNEPGSLEKHDNVTLVRSFTSYDKWEKKRICSVYEKIW